MNRSRSLSYFPVCAFKPGLACFRARHIAAVLSLPSEELTAIDGKSPLSTFQHPLPVDGFHRTKPFSFVRIQLLQIKNESCLLRTKLVLLFADLLTVPFACECFLHAFLLAWFQVKGVALDLFDNVLRLHLPLETTKSILQGLAFLNTNFCQDEIHLQTCLIGYLISISPPRPFRTNKINQIHQNSPHPSHPPPNPVILQLRLNAP
jgi:hypothetical protein